MTSFVVTKSLLALITALAVLATPVVAHAGEAPPVSAVSQYVEQIPTGAGSVAVGSGAKARGPLTRNARRALGKTDAETAAALTAITASAYGAPTEGLSAPRQLREDVDGADILRHPADSPSVGDSLSSVAEAVGGGSGERLPLLGAILLLTTIVAVGASLRARG